MVFKFDVLQLPILSCLWEGLLPHLVFFCPEKSVHLQHVHLHTHTGVSFWAYLQSYTVAPLAVCGGLALPVFVAYVKGMRTSAKLRWRRTLDRYPASLNPDGFAGHLICTMLWLKD